MSNPEFPDLPFIGLPRWYSEGRPSGPPIWIVIHATANTANARNEARYAMTRPREGAASSHFYIDDSEIVQSLPTWHRAWHAGANAGNPLGIAIEITGQVAWSRGVWLADRDDIDLAGRLCARLAAKCKIPLRWCSHDDLRAHRAGLTTHNDIRAALGGTDHTDPGAGFPADELLRVALATAGAPAPIPGPGPLPVPGQTWTEALVATLPTLQRGSRGSMVKRCQALVNCTGFTAQLAEDGDFGPRTAAGVRSVQQRWGLTVDEVVGRQTWTALLTR